MSIGTRILTWLKGELVGTDRLGNKYYQEKGKPYRSRRRRRWVVYNGEAEPSRVPPEWHGWLHYTVDSPPNPDQPRRPWQKDPVPNLTGTPLAYRPSGHEYQGGKRARGTGDYEPWTPA